MSNYPCRVSLQNGKCFDLDSVVNIFKASNDLASDLKKIETYAKQGQFAPAEVQKSESATNLQTSVEKDDTKFSIGLAVEARYGGGPRFYPGKITEIQTNSGAWATGVVFRQFLYGAL